jgi:hypothetical protein
VEKLLRLGQEKFAVEAEQEVVEEVPEFVYALY